MGLMQPVTRQSGASVVQEEINMNQSKWCIHAMLLGAALSAFSSAALAERPYSDQAKYQNCPEAMRIYNGRTRGSART